MRRLVMYSDGVRIVDIRDLPGLQTGQFAVELAAGRDARIEVQRLDLLSNEVRPCGVQARPRHAESLLSVTQAVWSFSPLLIGAAALP